MEPWTDAIKLFRHNGPQQTAVRQACFLARPQALWKICGDRTPDPRHQPAGCDCESEQSTGAQRCRMDSRAFQLQRRPLANEFASCEFNSDCHLVSHTFIQWETETAHLSAKTVIRAWTALILLRDWCAKYIRLVHKTLKTVCPFVRQSQWFIVSKRQRCDHRQAQGLLAHDQFTEPTHTERYMRL